MSWDALGNRLVLYFDIYAENYLVKDRDSIKDIPDQMSPIRHRLQRRHRTATLRKSKRALWFSQTLM